MKAIFICGTDTGVGKTLVCGCLARYLLEKGNKVITQKWIQTGFNLFSSDFRLHIKIMGYRVNKIKEYLPYVEPYIFKHASSPHLASKLENKRINIKKIIVSFKFLSGQFDFIIVEGTGGALVPINQKNLLIDIVKELDLPILLVVDNRLGAINHTLLTIEALKRREIKLLGLIFNNLKRTNRRILEDNPRIIKIFSNQRILGILPQEQSILELYKKFIPVGENILKLLRKNE